MRLALPLPVSTATTVATTAKGSGGFWQPIEITDDEPGEPGESEEPDDGNEPKARYFERSDRQNPGAARCLLIVSPLLPLPRSLPVLLQEALTGEPDFRLNWKWPLFTPRAGPWELVVQLCVGTSLSTGLTTGRLYIALDAGSGAYLIVCIDRDPQKLAERQKELLALIARARLHRDRVPQNEHQSEDPTDAKNFNRASTPLDTDTVPPQQPPPEIYLKEALFSYLTD